MSQTDGEVRLRGEFWNEGVRARAGVACADCHMPYLYGTSL